MPLSQTQCKHLRRLSHSLKPVVSVGGSGLTDNLLAELENALNHHELIKVRVRVGDRDRRDALLDDLINQSKATLLQRIGNVALLYREAEK
ncbi:MAG: YhbY family RNA-binding protein [Pseudomonadota bacterium]|nr:YhbY family RNA-binding protein [Pseudomonadota bacterium]